MAMQDNSNNNEKTVVPEDHGHGRGENPQDSKKSSWLSTPENLGNSAGEAIESTLSPAGEPVGKGLAHVVKPAGALVDGIVGGVMRSGEAFGEQVGVGYGNKDGGPARAREREGERLKEGLGGREENGENPLGL